MIVTLEFDQQDGPNDSARRSASRIVIEPASIETAVNPRDLVRSAINWLADVQLDAEFGRRP